MPQMENVPRRSQVCQGPRANASMATATPTRMPVMPGRGLSCFIVCYHPFFVLLHKLYICWFGQIKVWVERVRVPVVLSSYTKRTVPVFQCHPEDQCGSCMMGLSAVREAQGCPHSGRAVSWHPAKAVASAYEIRLSCSFLPMAVVSIKKVPADAAAERAD